MGESLIRAESEIRRVSFVPKKVSFLPIFLLTEVSFVPKHIFMLKTCKIPRDLLTRLKEGQITRTEFLVLQYRHSNGRWPNKNEIASPRSFHRSISKCQSLQIKPHTIEVPSEYLELLKAKKINATDFLMLIFYHVAHTWPDPSKSQEQIGVSRASYFRSKKKIISYTA